VIVNKKAIIDHPRLWMLLLAVIFAAVFSRSLVFVYTEGDDASTAAYHLLGRDPALQPVYSPINGMVDSLFSLLPADEGVLRVSLIGLSAAAAVIFTLLLLRLIFEWTGELSPRRKTLAACLVMLAIPELFYLGLIYCPTLMAMCLILGSHLLVRWVFDGSGLPILSNRANRIRLAISIVLFSLGAAFRWNTVVYGLIIVSDIFLRPDLRTAGGRVIRARAVFCVVWGAVALLGSGTAILLSSLGNINLTGSAEILDFALTQSMSVLSVVTYQLSLFTPGLVLVSLAGFILLIKRKDPLWIVSVLGFASNIPWMRTGTPKDLITLFPALAVCFVTGITLLWDLSWNKIPPTAFRAAILLLLVIPWMAGARVSREGTAWGPGFELRPFNFTDTPGTHIQPVLGSGSAFPTPEYTRPVYGYFYNLLLGDRAAIAVKDSREHAAILQTAKDKGIPVIITAWSPEFFLDDLYRQGYRTVDPATRKRSDGSPWIERRFTISGGSGVTTLYAEMADTSAADMVRQLRELRDQSPEAVIFGYPAGMRELYLACPQAMKAIESRSAILNLNELVSNSCKLD
jgi:hypothetical protein